MKYLLMAFLLCISITPAFATPIPAEMGPKYYQNCMKTPDPRLLPGSQDVFCKCTGANMVKNMTMEDLVGMKNNDRSAMNNMMIGAYAPCLETPVHDTTYTEFVKQGIAVNISECVATGIGKYTASEAQRLPRLGPFTISGCVRSCRRHQADA